MLGTIDGPGPEASVSVSGIESPLAKPRRDRVSAANASFWGSGSRPGRLAGSPDGTPQSSVRQKGQRTLIAQVVLIACRGRVGAGHFPLCKARGLCYTLARREPLRFRLFLGSSAVEHSTVNRMVAGSNPARGASWLFFSVRPCSQPFSTPPQPIVSLSLSACVCATTVRHRSHTSAIFWGYQTGYRRPALLMCSFDTPKWQVGDEA